MDRIVLANQTPLARGGHRIVFWHPAERELLIKVLRPEIIAKKYNPAKPWRWYKAFRRRRYAQYTVSLREIREQLAVQLDADRFGQFPNYVAKLVGFVETDFGLGSIVEAALDADGNLAPTLASMISDGRFDAGKRAELQAFTDELLHSPLIISDLTPNNVVYAFDPERDGHFKLIDGMGFRTLLAPERWAESINRISKRYWIGQFWKRVEKDCANMQATNDRPDATTDLIASGIRHDGTPSTA